MPLSAVEAFEKRQLTRDDGEKVVPPSLALVAALESGYRFKLSTMEEAAVSGKYPGLLTKDEFLSLCEKNPDNCLDSEAMAKHISVLAPNGLVTRASLQEAAAKTGSSEDALTNDEIDALFDVLDENNTGSISAEVLMGAIYGQQGREALTKQRKEYARAKEEAEKEAAAKEQAAKEAAEKEAAAKEAAAKAAAEKEAASKPAAAPKAEAPAAKKQKTMCGC
ncbi:I/6 autoantigen [Trypanosoma theileri]|uniref:I/6 autoantigen n=1 Tax=Trypanosoma theileri TaxID=67003 RepID=A0A1X0NTK1_9TRYP|nr:I/6 autoantigen [Trypanosoma theileri]ORC88012.1 I/6 autoantigen [Trypanosoma theileri]